MKTPKNILKEKEPSRALPVLGQKLVSQKLCTSLLGNAHIRHILHLEVLLGTVTCVRCAASRVQVPFLAARVIEKLEPPGCQTMSRTRTSTTCTCLRSL